VAQDLGLTVSPVILKGQGTSAASKTVENGVYLFPLFAGPRYSA